MTPLKQAFLKIEELEARLAERGSLPHEPIAIVGIGCRFPGGADGPDAFWRLLRDGVHATREVPPDRWDVDRFYDADPSAPGKTYSRRGGFLDVVDQFDAPLFKISPREAAVMDPQQRLLLEVAWEAFEHAGVPPRSLESSRTGVFVALSTNDYWNLQLRQSDLSQIGAYHGSGIAYSVASGRLSYVFGLQGPSISIDTACSGSLVAVHLACRSLQAGECRMALAGGVNLILSPDNSVIFAKSRMLAADGRCKTFDAAADGFGEGEGCGLVVLKLLSDAIADGSTVLAVIRGSAVNQDGPSSGLTAPNGPSQEAVIREALVAASMKPADIGYVEAHGTGTSLGDPIEVQALAAALCEERGANAPLWIGSVKTNVGHLEAAAGIAGLIKVALALQHKTIPAHLHFSTPNPHIPWADLNVAVPKTSVEWPGISGRRTAGVSAFGFSGTNAHVILESAAETKPAATDTADRPTHILTLSGATATALSELTARYASTPAANFADFCWSANTGRSPEPHRLAIVGDDVEGMRRALVDSGFRGVVESGDRPKVAFLFTGQGSQYAGMGQDLYRTQPAFRAALNRCSEILSRHCDRPLLSILFPSQGSAEVLHQTMYTQPALFSLEYALAELWQSWGVRPSAVLGHSLGEYVAAVIAGVWRLEDALALVAARGRMMQELPQGGEMAAVFADESTVARMLRTRPGVAIAAVNGPRNVVISGDAAGVRSALAELREAGVDAQALTVSHAFHSPRMDPILDRFEEAVRALPCGDAAIPVASNLTGSMIRGAAFDSRYWRRQLREPVRFADGIRSLEAAGIAICLEVGPNPTLIGMGQRVPGAEKVLWLPSLARGRNDWQVILGSLAELYTHGVDVNWKEFDRPYRRSRVAIPTYPFQRQRHWFDQRTTASPALHPLLQRRIPAAIGLFESDLDPAVLPWLAEHRVRGRIVLPATAYLEAARAAVSEILGRENLSLLDVVIGESLALADGETRKMQIVVTPDGREAARFQIFSSDPARQDSWRLHASGRAEMSMPAAHAFDDAASLRCTNPQDVDAHYRALAARRIELGATFRGVRALHSGEGEALGELSGEATDFEVHPVTLDAALQVLGAALPSEEHRGTYLPIGFDRVDFHARASESRLKSHVRLLPSAQPDSESLGADVCLYGDDGELLVSVAGLRLKRMPTDEVADWLYEVQWLEQPLPDFHAALPALRERALASGYDELLARLDAICGAIARRALAALGSDGVIERHQRLFGRLVAIAAEDGCRDNECDPEAELQKLLVEYPQFEAEIRLLARCGPQLAGVLRGHVDPLELLFPGGDTSTAERLYEQSPLAQAYNDVVRTAVMAAACKQNVRILEIGGGTGGTTSGLLPALSPGSTEYTFTDISPLFTAKASQKFRQYPFVRYRTLDIEKDPLAQGFDDRPFDIVVAANVLHATRDLAETMSHVRRLLAPDGLLVALEMVRRQRDMDLTFGMTDGWWRFTDRARRPTSLLMTSSQWLALLDESGFRDAAAVPAQVDEESRALNQAVLVARGAVTADSAWLVFESDAAESRELIDALQARGERVVRVRRGAAFAAIDDTHFVVNADNGSDYRRLREAVFPGTRRCGGIVHLWSLDAGPFAGIDADALDAAQSLGARSVLNLVQAFGGVLLESGRLSLVTRGAQALGAEPDLCPSQATLWGLANVIALEHPELRCLRIDLDPVSHSKEIAGLAAELFANTAEDQVLFRGARRYVARLARAEATPVAGKPVRFEVGTRGLLDSIRAVPMTRRRPDAGEVEIRVAATGLNLRDVLGAMNLYPGDPGPLGSECSGTITAVGPGVSGLQPGDEVLAIVPGCLASYVTAPAHFVVRRPASLTMEQAASVAIPYVTAHYALCHVGRLRAGEKVLIHAAAGGVGLAAVDLALRIGAEVAVTAGNEEKRGYLRSLGVRTVLDSRSTDFAAALSGVDVVLNSLGPEFVQPGLSVLGPGGRFIEIAKTGILSAGQIAALRPEIEYHVVDWSEQARQTPELIRSILDTVVSDLASGKARPLPVQTFPAADAIAAFRFMGNARHTGKIVLLHHAEIRADSTYLITGGLRGLGLLVAERFVELGARNLILMGRAEPSTQALETIARLESSGARVVVARADVSRESELARELERAAAVLPRIAGVIHSAGVLNDGVLQRLEWAQFREVLAPKVRGSWNLYRIFRGQPLDFFVCFSSIAGLFGSPGQANHAAANAFLDTFTSFLRASGIPAQSINWGAWSEVGAAAERRVGERVIGRGVESMAPQGGLDALREVMRRGAARMAVTPMRWDKFLSAYPEGAAPAFFSAMARPVTRTLSGGALPAKTAIRPIRDRLAHAPAGTRRNLLVSYLSQQVARVLGRDISQELDPRQPLTDMGLDSLMAVELRNLIGSGMGLAASLPATIVYDYPSIQEMAGYLESQLPFDSQPAARASVNDFDALNSIEELSDEEVDRLFAARVVSMERV